MKPTGKAETDDRKDVGRSSSSEAGESNTGLLGRMVSADEEVTLSSPSEMAAETDTALPARLKLDPVAKLLVENVNLRSGLPHHSNTRASAWGNVRAGRKG